MREMRTFHYFFIPLHGRQQPSMKRWKCFILSIVGGIGISIVVLLIVATIALHSEAFRRQIVRQSTILLTDKLKTKVSMKDADINLIREQIDLRGIEIEDRKSARCFR